MCIEHHWKKGEERYGKGLFGGGGANRPVRL